MVRQKGAGVTVGPRKHDARSGVARLAKAFGCEPTHIENRLSRAQVQWELHARTTERAFLRSLKRQGGFFTVTGHHNQFVRSTGEVIELRTARSKENLRIPRLKLREAMRKFYGTRTITRRELEEFSCYSSALMGLLHAIFEEIAKVLQASNGLVRLTLKGVRFFFAGLDRSPRDMRIAAENGAKYILLSYAHLRKSKAWKEHVQSLGLRVLLDSGAFSVMLAKRKGKPLEPITVQAYATFIAEHRDCLEAWFNLDVIGDAQASEANASYLCSVGLPPVPVWHGTSSMELLAQLVAEGHPLIAIGGTALLPEGERETIFSQVFERFPTQNFHGLGLASGLLLRFEWFSADSTAWLIGRKYRKLLDGGTQRVAPEHMSPLEVLARNVASLCGLEWRINEDGRPVRDWRPREDSANEPSWFQLELAVA